MKIFAHILIFAFIFNASMPIEKGPMMEFVVGDDGALIENGYKCKKSREIKVGDSAVFTVGFKNVGDAPLLVKFKSNSDMLKTDFPPGPVNEGVTKVLTLTLTPLEPVKDFEYTVDVTTNETNKIKRTIIIRGDVIKAPKSTLKG